MHAIGPHNPSPLPCATAHRLLGIRMCVSSCFSWVHGWALVSLVIGAKAPSCIMHELTSFQNHYFHVSNLWTRSKIPKCRHSPSTPSSFHRFFHHFMIGSLTVGVSVFPSLFIECEGPKTGPKSYPSHGSEPCLQSCLYYILFWSISWRLFDPSLSIPVLRYSSHSKVTQWGLSNCSWELNAIRLRSMEDVHQICSIVLDMRVALEHCCYHTNIAVTLIQAICEHK